MKEPKFSKGEWTIGKSYKDNFVAINANRPRKWWGEFASVVIRMEGDDKDSEEGVANANLIKTAPKLYYMLQEISESGELMYWSKDIEKLLAEARGEI